jgi:hypothetical protein
MLARGGKKMKLNESNTDRIIRVGLALVFFVLAFTLKGALVWLMGLLGVVMLVTATVGFCPIYALFGISTCSVKTRV